MAEQNERSLRSLRELSCGIQNWLPKRQNTIESLRSLADELMEHHKKVNIAKVSGSTASVAGFGLIAAGFGLAPVTFGISFILSAVGGAICAVGGTTVVGSSIAERRIFKTRLEHAQKMINDDRKAQKAIQEASEKLSQEISEASSKVRNGQDAALLGKNVGLMVKNLVDVGRGVKAAARVGTTAASEGAEVVMRSIGISASAARGILFGINAVFLPLDIYTMVTSSMKIDAARKGKKEKEPEAVKMLRSLANELEKEQHESLNVLQQLTLIEPLLH